MTAPFEIRDSFPDGSNNFNGSNTSKVAGNGTDSRERRIDETLLNSFSLGISCSNGELSLARLSTAGREFSFFRIGAGNAISEALVGSTRSVSGEDFTDS